jgi:hypothetical protein
MLYQCHSEVVGALYGRLHAEHWEKRMDLEAVDSDTDVDAGVNVNEAVGTVVDADDPVDSTLTCCSPKRR